MSNVKTAVGSEKQFSPQPRALYQKNLQGLSGNIRVDVDASTKSQDLARSLGVLGDTLEADFISKEKNKKKIGIAEAERIISSQSEEDMMKLSVIELLNNHSEHSIADNPYAITTIEKMRGKYFGARAKTEYDVWRKDQPPVKEASEEVARYTKYVQDTYGEVSGVATDQEAFQKGFYDNFIPDQKEKADGFLKEKATEMDIIRQGSTLASLSETAERGNIDSKEDIAKKLNETFGASNLAGASSGERVKYMDEFLDNFVMVTGDYEKAKYLAENVILGTDLTGNPIKASGVIPLSSYFRKAEVRTGQLNRERFYKTLKDLETKPIAEIYAMSADWEKNDPHWFQVMAPHLKGVIDARERAEQKAKMDKANSQVDSHVKGLAQQSLNYQYEGYLAGSTHAFDGNAVASSFSFLPKIPYQKYDKDGLVEEKEYSFDRAEVFQFVNQKTVEIAQSDMSPEAKNEAFLKLYNWPPADQVKGAYKMAVDTALDNLNTDRLQTNAKGAILSDQALSAIDMYKTNPEMFTGIFGQDTATKVATLATLSQGAGSLEGGVASYASANDKRKDPVRLQEAKTKLASYISTESTLKGFTSLTGESVELKLAGNASLHKQVEEQAINYVLAENLAPKTAVEKSLENVRKSNYVYRDTSVPKSIFNGIHVENKAARGQQTLNWFVEDFKQETGVEDAYISTEYDSIREIFIIRGGGTFKSHTVNDITWQGNEMLRQEYEQGKAQSGSRNVTLEDIKRPEYSIPEHEDEWRND